MGIIIVGNSGAARECFWVWCEARQHYPATPDFKGFLAWRGHVGNLCELEDRLLGSSDEYQPVPDDLFVIGIGHSGLRRAVYEHYKQLGVNFFTLIHPTVFICPSATIGEANIFQRYSTVYANANVGNANYLNGSVNIAHDARIGDCNTLNSYSMVLGSGELGSDNQLGPRTIILDRARAGNGNVFAPDTVVFRWCGDGCLMAGNPALVRGSIGEKTG